MTRDPRPESEAPGEEALREGLLSAFSLFLSETTIRHAVGETGLLRGHVEVFLERGRAKHSKGAVSFERRVELRNG